MHLPDDETVLSYSGHSDGIACLAWSPNGKSIASGGHDKTIRIWNAATGETAVVCHAADVVCALAWAPDGATLLAGSWNQPIVRWDTASGSVRTTYETVLGTIYGLAYAPDGATFTAAGELAPDQPTAFAGSAPIALVETTTGRTRLLYRGHTGLWTSDVAWAPNGALSSQRVTTIRPCRSGKQKPASGSSLLPLSMTMKYWVSPGRPMVAMSPLPPCGASLSMRFPQAVS
jgi:WD40 repeat protein